MTQNSMITNTTATSEDIGVLIEKLETALEGEISGNCLIAMLSLCVLMQKPNIEPEQLQAAIRDASRFICLVLEGMDIGTPNEDGSAPTVTLN